MADIFGKAFALGVGQIDADLRDELQVLSDRLGIDLITILEQGPATLEALLQRLEVDVRVEVRTPERDKLAGILDHKLHREK